MNAWSYALAAALLTTPPEVPDPPPDAEDWPAIQEAIQSLAVEWEILDPREVRYVMARVEDWDNDIALLRRRYQELKDAPKLCDAQRFPDRNTVNELLAFNRAYRRHLDSRQALEQDRGHNLRTALKETDYLVPGVGFGPGRPLRVLLHHGPPAGAESAAADGRAGGVQHRRPAAVRAAVAVPGNELIGRPLAAKRCERFAEAASGSYHGHHGAHLRIRPPVRHGGHRDRDPRSRNRGCC